MAEKMRLGLTMAVMVMDSRPSHDFIAISIAFLDSLPMNSNTNLFRFGTNIRFAGKCCCKMIQLKQYTS